MPLVLASTEIKIKTVADHRISLIVRGEGKLTTVDSFHKDTIDGTMTFTTSASFDYLDFIVALKKDNIKVINKKFESKKSGETWDINMVPGEENIITSPSETIEEEEIVEEVEENSEGATEETSKAAEEGAEDTEVNTGETNSEEETLDNEATETTEEERTDEDATSESESPSPITGQAIKDLIPGNTSYLLWIVVAVAILATVIVFAKNKLANKPSSTSPYATDARIRNAEKKIREAQEEINRLKSKDERTEKLRRLEERYKQDQEAIKKLKEDL
tara:strand:- start:6341 stop:7168 length:828 start_codon:yes stop_codon:yes gene_type:complete